MTTATKNSSSEALNREQVKLLNRVRRVRGQLDAVERALQAEDDCANVLMMLAACRGGISALMAEVLEDHIRLHLVQGRTRESSKDLADDLIDIVHAYFK
jgi:FrmR/RcnR family transcriptional regulator, repressor of rcnA expression